MDNFEPQSHRNPESEPIPERLKKLENRVSEMHDTYRELIMPLYDRKNEIWERNSSRLAKIASKDRSKGGWNTPVEEFMAPKDAVEYQSITQQLDNFNKAVIELTADVAETLRDAGGEVQWTKRSEIPQVPTGALEQESFDAYFGNSQAHLVTDDSESRRTGLSTYSIRIFRTIEDVSFPGSTIFVLGKSEGGYSVDEDTARAFDKDEQEKVIQSIIGLVKQVNEQNE